MKKLIAALLLALLLAGCGRETQEDHRIRVIERSIDYQILVDTDTGVCYIRNMGTGGICVMVDHTGKPYIANGWRDWGGDDE